LEHLTTGTPVLVVCQGYTPISAGCSFFFLKDPVTQRYVIRSRLQSLLLYMHEGRAPAQETAVRRVKVLQVGCSNVEPGEMHFLV